MNSNTLKVSLWWIVKAAVLVCLSLVVIFLSAPKAEAAVLTGNMITSGGIPAVRFDDDAIVKFESGSTANHFWGSVGSRVQIDGDVRQSTIFALKSVVVVDGDQIWEDTNPSQGGGIVVTPVDRIQGRLIVRHTNPAVDISPELLYGGYSDVTLDNLGADLRAELLKLASGYGGDIIADGDLDGLVMHVDNLWVNGVQRKQLSFAQ